MRLVGVLEDTREATGYYTLHTQGHDILSKGHLHDYCGKRVAIVGVPRRAEDQSYFDVRQVRCTDEPDSNWVCWIGNIVSRWDERAHPRHGKSSCLIVSTADTEKSTVLVTALATNSDEVQRLDPQPGDSFRVGGYMVGRGTRLHVIMRQLYKRGGAEK